MDYTIKTTWDDESSVWVAESTDIPGFVLESGSLDALMERARHAIPELLELNRISTDSVSTNIPTTSPTQAGLSLAGTMIGHYISL